MGQPLELCNKSVSQDWTVPDVKSSSMCLLLQGYFYDLFCKTVWMRTSTESREPEDAAVHGAQGERITCGLILSLGNYLCLPHKDAVTLHVSNTFMLFELFFFH